VAARTPAPGGGSSAAWATALAAALVEMAARFADADPSRPAELRAEALRLAEVELHAYEPVLRASGPDERAAALSAAADSPLAIARVAAEVAALGGDLARNGKESVKGDALTGALLAEGACRAAASLVEINLAGSPGDPRLAEAADLARRAAAAN
jgi:methenyltetrahydrofolate cyclohydrolase